MSCPKSLWCASGENEVMDVAAGVARAQTASISPYRGSILALNAPTSPSISRPHSSINCRHATAGQRKESTWYQYGFDRPQGPLPGHNATGSLVRQFTRHVRHQLGLPDPAMSASTTKRGIVLFSRTRNRLVVNEVSVASSCNLLSCSWRYASRVLHINCHIVQMAQ